ncbi:MAG: hypothetical protein L0Y36_01515 [Planctomycetales bacterium]|nr:hypothetical protein [Planctomycetales bacterium]
MKTGIFAITTGLCLWACASVLSYPGPAVVQPADQWTFQVKYSQPEQILLRLPGKDKPQRFWYIILTVTNTSPLDDVEFYPACQLITDTFEVINADKKVPKAVFDMVARKHQGSYPFLESLDFVEHRVFSGEDNTRDFAIIWPDFDPKTRQVSLFIGGLSNETAVIDHPKLKDQQGNPQKVYLQKTLKLNYSVAGDEKLRDAAVMKEIETTWVMR